MDHDQYVEIYSVVCDAVERAWQRMPADSFKDEQFMHTSSYAREAANRVMKTVEEGDPLIYSPETVSRLEGVPEDLRSMLGSMYEFFPGRSDAWYRDYLRGMADYASK